MKKIFTILFALSTLAAQAVDWDKIEWLGNGSGNDANTNKYKIALAEGQQVANIQVAPWDDNNTGIYTWFESGVTSVSVEAGIQGAGVLLHLSAFTAKETKVTVVCATKTYEFYVFYANGTGEITGGGDNGGNGGNNTDTIGTGGGNNTIDGIDWDKIEWLGNGSGNNANTNKYKIALADGQQVANIQVAPWDDNNVGIYTWFESGVTSVSVDAGIQGAGVLLYLSSFTAQVTKVTVVCATKTYEFYVYYADGIPNKTPLWNTSATKRSVKVVENGQIIIISNGVRLNIFGQPINQ